MYSGIVLALSMLTSYLALVVFLITVYSLNSFFRHLRLLGLMAKIKV